MKVFKLDVTDSFSIQKAFLEIKEEYKTIDCLLNNAGYALFGPLELSSEEQIRRAYDTLSLGVTFVTKQFIPLLRENGGGSIITISSVGGCPHTTINSNLPRSKIGSGRINGGPQL
ncbi:SDR family NAD(P)-dependent oxidoreductase [Streptococcus agalactiae]|uniref:SDR family NAD(P)-dependent oxidoreductase n=3 Tax=Streptococcus agalactiae TaxID=1311 RepID=UPI00178C333C